MIWKQSFKFFCEKDALKHGTGVSFNETTGLKLFFCEIFKDTYYVENLGTVAFDNRTRNY